MLQELKRLEDEILCERQNTTNEASLRKSAEVKYRKPKCFKITLNIKVRLRELEVRLENESLLMSLNGKKYIEKLETKLRSLETELEQEVRRSRDSVKLARQMERNYRDMEYQYNQERKNYQKMEVASIYT